MTRPTTRQGRQTGKKVGRPVTTGLNSKFTMRIAQSQLDWANKNRLAIRDWIAEQSKN